MKLQKKRLNLPPLNAQFTRPIIRPNPSHTSKMLQQDDNIRLNKNIS
jgi:hypothetical protein